MISDRLKDAFITHMNAEFQSYYLYLSMSAYLDENSWTGMTNWMAAQAEEEREHAMKFYEHLAHRGVRPILKTIAEPKHEWNSVLEIFEDSLEHEKQISSLIHNLMDIAVEERDHIAQSFLQWFIDEQVEEEDTVGTIVDQIKRVADDPRGLMLIDAELGKRQQSAP